VQIFFFFFLVAAERGEDPTRKKKSEGENVRGWPSRESACLVLKVEKKKLKKICVRV
jgi:hypothetical protein